MLVLPLPAHKTKHISTLYYNSFSLSQLDNGVTNGTALWLGAQALSAYLATTTKSRNYSKTPRVIELGSGIGLVALTMASLGWDVLATDIPNVINTVLGQNIARNMHDLPGTVQVRELDWTVPPENWVWDDSAAIASLASSSTPSETPTTLLTPPFDLIISSDTLYHPDLICPLLRSLQALSKLSSAASSSARSPPIYICLERRDPVLIDRALTDAKLVWGFNVERIPHKKVVKSIEKNGLKWTDEDWGGVEIWKLVLVNSSGHTCDRQ